MSRVQTPNHNGNYPEFDAAYWAAQPPAVQRLHATDDYNQRRLLASVLAEQGYVIDGSIMVFGWDPGKIMAARIEYGYKTVPAVGQPNVAIAPGVNQAGLVGSAFDGVIKVSLDLDDYPPYVAPNPAPLTIVPTEDKPKV